MLFCSAKMMHSFATNVFIALFTEVIIALECVVENCVHDQSHAELTLICAPLQKETHADKRKAIVSCLNPQAKLKNEHISYE